MTTTSSTTATSASQIALALGAGSGIDTAAIVTSLVNAQFAGKTAALTSKTTAVTAQISEVAKLQSGITGFASALTSLIKGGTLLNQPTSSNAAVAAVTTALSGKVGALDATLTVAHLAAAQTATTATPVASRSTAVGTGNLTLTFGTATVADGAMTGFVAGSASPVSIAIDSTHQSLDGIASAINAAKAGVTASVVTDVDGTARLTLKGATGSAQAFTLSGDTTELSALNVGVGESATTIGSAATNAALSLDGVAVERATNSFSDLIDGVKFTLTGTGTTTLGASRPTTALTQAVNDYVDTYNQLHAIVVEATDPVNGTLKQDSATAALAKSLTALPLTNLVTGGDAGAPTTLAEIGVATNRDGTLSVRADVLAKALATWPDAVEAMFADGTGASGKGIGAALTAISTSATSAKTGLAASTSRYTAVQSDIADQQDKLNTLEDATKTRLTQQYSAMDSQVAAYKSTQSFLTAQIAAWNKPTN
ncbi:flagellar filament capping protein FliD [soil metagenome]